MPKRIAMFNHKGGVSKTTTTFHLGWMLASKGHRVVLVDADPQCNLSGLILGFHGETEFESFYQAEKARNIRAGLAPAFESQPRAIEAVECVHVSGCDGLVLLPGHIRLSEYEVTLGIAQELSGSIQTLQNLPGSISYLLNVTAEKYSADIVLVDMNPSLSSINQNLLMTSDFFVVPTSPDYFSVMAIESLTAVIPRWQEWSVRAKQNSALKGAAYPYPGSTPKLLGTIIQKYRPRKGAPTVGFQKWIDLINDKVSKQLVTALEPLKMTLSPSRYGKVPDLLPNYCLAQIADFNTLITRSQDFKTPVFALTDDQLGHVGTVLESDQGKRTEFEEVFSDLADGVLTLVADESVA
jgi:cellulose biosynthesis protein BcsQ